VIVTLHQLAKLSQSAEYKNLHINNVSLSSANGCSSPTTIPEIDFTALEPLIGSRELFNGDDEDEEQQQLLLQKQNEQEKILDFMTVLHEEEEGEEKQSSLKMDIISRSRSINGHNLNEKYANMAENINENGRNEILDYCQEEKDGGYWSEKVSSFESRSIVDNPASPTGVKKFEFNLDFEEKTVLKNQNILQMTSSESLKIVEEVETRENDRKLSSENSDKNGKFSTTFDDDDNDDDSPDDFRRLSDDDEGGDMTPLEASNYNYRKMSDAPKKSQSSIKGVRDDNGQEIPTRKGSKNTNLNSSTKEALKYVKVKSILDDTAKKQISIVEEQKKFIGLEVIKTDKDEEWKNDLENWTKKRKLIRVKAEKTFDDFRNAALHNGARKPYNPVNGQEKMDRLKSDNHELGNGESYLSNEKDGINNNHKMSKSLNGKFGRHFSESSATVDDRFN
uniref:Uncharacterized protein n=1 Tax=Romanomermis culicivorax TaxID=13658 RepID=A0A915L117_ROMCU